MFRIKYLFGVLIGSFGLMYLVFAILSMKSNDAATDTTLAYGMFSAHTVLSVLLLISSYNDRKKEYARLEELFQLLKEINGGRVSTDEFADIAGISPEDAHIFLRKKSSNQMGSYVINSDGKLIQPLDFEDKDF